MKVHIHGKPRPTQTVHNPLGSEGVRHRMWTWADGSWLLIRFFDDGVARAVTSDDLRATLSPRGRILDVRLEPGALGADPGDRGASPF